MSSTRLLLEGSDLPALVRQAEELGGRVVRAQRLRKGVLGRRWYEVTVEVPQEDDGGAQVITPAQWRRPPPAMSAAATVAAARTAARARPAGIDDLISAAEAAEAAERSFSADARASRAASSRQRAGR